MTTNTSALKTFAQETRKKLISLIGTKMDFILTQDTAQLRGFESQIAKLKSAIASKSKEIIVEEVAYTWFNRVMALRYMDANGYTDLKVVTPDNGQMRPEILQDAMAGNIDDELHVKVDDNPTEAVLYRRLLVAICNQYGTIMPFLFEHICDYTEMLLPDDLLSDQSFVTDIRKGMTDEDCQNVEIMGWLYQFYITDRKKDAEDKKSKKGGLKSDEQAAATQLFTPHWIVRYMVENSLGRIWMTLHPESKLIESMPYYIAPIDGQKDVIPKDIRTASDIKFLDPCMGSGHILVYAFDLFCKMYEEEGFQSREIPALIFKNNLYGMDIDRRCYQLACFALTMKGRAYHNRYLRKVVEPNVIALQPIDHDTIEASGSWEKESLMWQFENIDTIGSLLKVTPEEYAAIRVEDGLFRYNQQILKTQAEYLSSKYHCVVTNPPYLGKGMSGVCKNYVQNEFPNSKADTMATFMERCKFFSDNSGYFAMINMHTWMYLPSYKNLRGSLLNSCIIKSLLHLGPKAFDEISGEVVKSVAFVVNNIFVIDSEGSYYRLVEGNSTSAKENLFLSSLKGNNKLCFVVSQNVFAKMPDNRLGAYWASERLLEVFKNPYLSTYSSPRKGNSTSDNNRFLRLWFEIDNSKMGINYPSIQKFLYDNKRWLPYNKGGGTRKWYGYNESLVDWKDDAAEMRAIRTSVVTNEQYYMKPGLTWSTIASGAFGVRYFDEGFIFDNGGCCIFDLNDKRDYIAGLLNSSVLKKIMTTYTESLNYQSGEVSQMPILIRSADTISSLSRNCFAISKADWDTHETSWDFKTNELLRLALGLTYDQIETSLRTCDGLNISVESLISQYETYWEEKLIQLQRNEEELNRQFIEIYGLQEELTPDVPLNEITILQKGEISIESGKVVWHKDVVIKQFISWMVGCFMGRYSADKPGLIIASQGQKLVDLELPTRTLEIDDDGIIPIIQEADFFADDMTQRIEAGVRTLFGERNFYDNIAFINVCLGKELRDYLYKDFYADHIDGKMYQKRPIYWLFSSKMGDKKKKGYFKAIVYMHRIESDTLSKLHADYVSPYIDKIERQKQEAEDNAVRDDLSQAQRNKATKQVAELADKIRELKEFATILVQMSTQRLTIDLDDGVRVNYPKYYPLVEPIKGLDKEE